jgi:hypothetical protein
VPLLILALLFCVIVALGGAVVLSLVLRYRAGTARRQGRLWVATVNFWSAAIGAGFFLLTAACLSFWIRPAFRYALLGMLAGAVLGMLGLALTRWESKAETVYYTPNRWLGLLIVFALIGRLAYGWWRGVHMAGSQPHSWLTSSGTALSMAVAAGIIGYYLSYALGVRRRLMKHYQRHVP